MSESIELVNKRLSDYFGVFETGEPNWRVVWSEDQFEDRHGEYEDRTPEGILIRRVTGVRRVPKYRQWIPEKWVLESLIIVPKGTGELFTKTSYEPIYAFPYRDDKPLVPSWPAVKFLIDGVMSQVGITSGVKYGDPEADPKEAIEVKEQRLKQLEEELFGNESDIGDALAYNEGVGYTGPAFTKES